MINELFRNISTISSSIIITILPRVFKSIDSDLRRCEEVARDSNVNDIDKLHQAYLILTDVFQSKNPQALIIAYEEQIHQIDIPQKYLRFIRTSYIGIFIT